MTLAERMAAIADHLSDSLPERVVTRSFEPYENRVAEELEAGIYTLISAGEQEYANWVGRAAQLGKQPILISGQFRLEEDATGEEIEDAEFAMIEEIKAICQTLPDAIGSLILLRTRQSRQLERPYGWVLAELEYGP